VLPVAVESAVVVAGEGFGGGGVCHVFIMCRKVYALQPPIFRFLRFLFSAPAGASGSPR
jgi:hypothetical protein